MPSGISKKECSPRIDPSTFSGFSGSRTATNKINSKRAMQHTGGFRVSEGSKGPKSWERSQQIPAKNLG